MGKLKLLDLFCGAGGAAKGYARAGFTVTGVDHRPQPSYPYRLIRADAMRFPLEGFDVIHASPPCQHYSDLARGNWNHDEWPDLIEPLRDRLIVSGLPYVIENVEGAPLIEPITLCGTMFPKVRVIRHRLFESNVALTVPPHREPHPLVFTHDKRRKHYGSVNQDHSYVMVNGGGNATLANKRRAMGIEWMSGPELNQALPPAYTLYIGNQLVGALNA